MEPEKALVRASTSLVSAIVTLDFEFEKTGNLGLRREIFQLYHIYMSLQGYFGHIQCFFGILKCCKDHNRAEKITNDKSVPFMW